MRRAARLLMSTASIGACIALAAPADAAQRYRPRRIVPDPRIAMLETKLDQARQQIAGQQAELSRQADRLRAIEARLVEPLASNEPAVTGAAPAVVGQPSVPGPPTHADVIASAQGSAPAAGNVAGIQQPIQPVGEAPAESERPPEVAVLGSAGSVVTRAGQLTGEMQFDYARADRNRALFRGIELVESVLVGVFDINESRQDVLTASGSLRYGLTDKLELGVRVPFVHRADNSVLTPIQGSTANDAAQTIDNSAKGSGIGDLELSARYQLTTAKHGLPYLIANLQAVVPTGTDPFEVKRDTLGEATEAATGAGFWGVSPSLTAILPTDPAVLFGTVGYTFNFGHDVDTLIPPVQINYVDPGNALSFSGGIGIALNERTSLNLGYAHTWAFGTRTRTRVVNQNGTYGPWMTATARDLQLGRLLLGMTYRVNDRASINWSVEVGATDDATDLRTVLRIPIILLTGG